MLTERSEDGINLTLHAIDAGPYTSSTVPTLGTLTLGTPAQHVVNVPVTLGADGDPVVIEVINSGTGITRHIDKPMSANDWRRAMVVTASATYAVPNLPSGTTIQVRIRSEPIKKLRLPSAWVIGGFTGAGDGYRDTTAYTKVTSLTTSTAAATAAELITANWTNGVSYLPVSVGIVEGGASFPDFGWLGNTTAKLILPPGTTRCVLNPYCPKGGSTLTYKVNVGHVDGFGGEGSNCVSAASFTVATSFTGPTLPTPTLTLVTAATTGQTGFNAGIPMPRRDVVTGFRLTVAAAVLGAGSPLGWGMVAVLQRDTSGAFASPVEIGRYEGNDVGPALMIEYLYPDTDTTIYFRCRLEETGFNPSAWSGTVSGKPAVIR
jgi:hypothetical protein